ncbi:hypothetical protein GO660_09595 [Staphylococcus aureus]|nr:hypothetical protein [Staphylococcus aureus]MVI00987.1 hypothetical protein [Staphylococcus aureus]MVI25726.1 hypothetical protein [Staphylococcus aureus]MVI29806.1 hypothetical protein [Staphylococcus aureus]MVI87362.1 hypothetical protein [Staphylococcus aureus]
MKSKQAIKDSMIYALVMIIISTLACMYIMKIKLNRTQEMYDKYEKLGVPVKETVNTNVHDFWGLLQVTMSDWLCVTGILAIGLITFLAMLNYKVFSE